MNKKTTWAVVLAFALLSPFLDPAGAHNREPSADDGDFIQILLWNDAGTLTAGGHVDDDRLGAAGASVGVSGRYTSGPASYAGLTGTFFPIELVNQAFLPAGLQASLPLMWCDLEVLGDGTLEAAEDEPFVDSEVNDNWAGVQSEGQWDDGGLGGACHTTQYNYANYNTPGCPSGTGVSAEDAVSGPLVWIGAACDVLAGDSGSPQADELALCLLNEAVRDKDFIPCAVGAIACLNDPATCADPPVIVCGSDGKADDINFGRGSGHAAPAVFFPATPCPVTGGTAAVFALNGVHTDVPANPASMGLGSVTVSAVTTGWIESHVDPTANMVCDPDRWIGLGDDDSFDNCRSMNSAMGNCQRNGDCHCGSRQPGPLDPPDTDKDGVPDSSDPDKDCDHLANDLEQALGLPTLAPNDWWDLRPLDDGKIKIRIGVKSVNVKDKDGPFNGSDPYAKKVLVNFWGPQADDVHKLSVEISGFKDGGGNHPDDLDQDQWHDFDLDADGWSTLKGSTADISADFRDLLAWKWRTNAESPLTSLPQGDVFVKLMDDDDGGTGECVPGNNCDDDMGELTHLMGDLYNLAGRTLVGGVPKFTPSLTPTLDASDIDLKVQLGADVCAASISWALAIAQGAYIVQLASLGSLPVSAC